MAWSRTELAITPSTILWVETSILTDLSHRSVSLRDIKDSWGVFVGGLTLTCMRRPLGVRRSTTLNYYTC